MRSVSRLLFPLRQIAPRYAAIALCAVLLLADFALLCTIARDAQAAPPSDGGGMARSIATRRIEAAPRQTIAVNAHTRGSLAASTDENAGAGRDSVSGIPGLPPTGLAAGADTGFVTGRASDNYAAAIAAVLFGWSAGVLTFLAIRMLGRQRRVAAELRRSEERLKREQAVLQSTLENIGDGLSAFDRQGRLIAWNARFAELLDLPIALTTDTTLAEIVRLQAQRGEFGPVDPESETQSRLERFYRDVPSVRERVTRNGRVLQLRRRAMPDGGVVTVYSDISEVKASEREMVQARREAEQANEAKSEFLANMSHELRTPLNAIIGFSEVICAEMLGPMQNPTYLDYVGDIHSSGLHLLSIINDVLDMSKIEAGRFELFEEPVVVQQIVGIALRMLHERAQSRGIALSNEQPAENIAIRGDERALKQVLLNILSNAIKFSNEGGRVIIRTMLRDAERVVIEVEDFGIGMDDEEQKRALQPFGQAKAVTTRTHGGTGLGLPITKGLVEAHGGRLVIRSVAGSGTLVRVELPRRLREVEAPAPASPDALIRA